MKTTKEKILEAAKQCPEAKKTLQTLFPDAFDMEYSPWQIIIVIDDTLEFISIIKKLESEMRFGLFSMSRAILIWSGSCGTFEHCINFAKEHGKLKAFDNEEDFHKFMAEYYTNKLKS